MKSKWAGFARVVIVILTLILIMNSVALFTNIRRALSYTNRAYGLSAMDDSFNEGRYEEIYEYTLKNEFTTEEVKTDISQYEAFGRYFHAYTLSKMYPEETRYKDEMAEEKQKITWNKIINVINELEKVSITKERSYKTD